MFQIRNAVKVLANVSDSEWAELMLMLEVGEKVNPTESVTEKSPASVSKHQTSIEDQKAIEKRLYDLLKELGVRSNILGYKYVQKAILLVMEDPKLVQDIVKGLYFKIADEFGTTSSRVERSIRHAVETACEIGNTDKMEEIFGYMYSSEKGKPTNSAFIAGIVEYLHYN